MHARKTQGISVPAMIYGTAWKEAETRALTARALAAGFRGVDSANQRKHYVEADVGLAVADAAAAGIAREQLFLQTKFTYQRGQDERLPYDPRADFATQVRQSFASSLEHLGTTWVDGYLLHGPWGGHGLAAADWEVWRAMEALHADGRVRLLGISNVTREQLEALYRGAAVKPALVQNRCYARHGWDRAVRAFCTEHDILYQGFSLLTANVRELATPTVEAIVARSGRTLPEVVFRFALAVGMVVLTGTTREAHMRLDLAAADLALEASEVRALEACAG